ESFQEGVRIPPVKLVRGGVLQQDIVDVLAANSRVPQSNWGDLNGQLNALDLGERRLHALLGEYGDDTIAAALAALTARAEELMRPNIRALPDGTCSCDDFLDNDGVTDTPLRIAVDLTIRDDRMTLDFSRSAPACDGPLNIARSTAIASCYVALKHIFVDVPSNAGCLAPIDFVIPDTTLLGVSAPRPVAGYTETILRVIDVIFGAFAKVAPDRAHGSPFATINARSLAGWRRDARRRATGWPALDHVLLLRRRPRRQSGNRRAQPQQQPDLDRHHSAGRGAGVALSGDVHPVGAAAGLGRSRQASRRARRDLRDRGARRRRPPPLSHPPTPTISTPPLPH